MTKTVKTADTTVTTTAPAAAAALKEPSKKSRALEIFQAKMTERTQGLFASNKEFRAAVLTAIQAGLGVSVASAATMYNAAKKDAETADATVALGRDPKKVKAPSTGKRGRPTGSKNKAKEVVPATVIEPGVVLTVIDAAAEPAVAADAAAEPAVAADAAA